MLLVVAGVALLAPVIVANIVVLAATARVLERFALRALSGAELLLAKKLDDLLLFEHFGSPAKYAQTLITGTLAVWLSCLFVCTTWISIDEYAAGIVGRGANWIISLMFGTVLGSLLAILFVDRAHEMRLSKRAAPDATADAEPKKRTLVGPLVSYATVKQTNPSP